MTGLTKKRRKAAVDPSGYKVVSVRMRTAEYLGLQEQAEKVGVTNNRAMRIAARRIAGFLEIDAETRRTLRDITNNIGRIAGDLNKLNQTAQRSGNVDLDKLDKQRTAFGEEFAQLDNQLQILLNVSYRREDGLALLKEAQSP